MKNNRRSRVTVRLRAFGFFYFILNSPTLTRDVTCSMTLLGQKKYEEAMLDEHTLGSYLENKDNHQTNITKRAFSRNKGHFILG